jgi:hypothetical protein
MGESSAKKLKIYNSLTMHSSLRVCKKAAGTYYKSVNRPVKVSSLVELLEEVTGYNGSQSRIPPAASLSQVPPDSRVKDKKPLPNLHNKPSLNNFPY